MDLVDAKPDGVIICTENSKHRPLVEMAAARGVNILCEKPLATTLEDARAMLDACQRAGVLLMTAFPMRFSAPMISVKSRLDAGDFGKVYCFNATNQGELPTRHRQWFVDPELAGGGAIMDHTVHLVDIMRWYLGSEVSEVYAQSNRIFHAKEVLVETGALEMLTFQNGVYATIDASWCRPPILAHLGWFNHRDGYRARCGDCGCLQAKPDGLQPSDGSIPSGFTGVRTPTRQCWLSSSLPSGSSASRR